MLSRSLKVLILASGKASTQALDILIAIVLSHVLTKFDYATYRQTFLVYKLFYPVLTLSLPLALYYFLPGEHSRPGGVLLENLILLFLGGILFSAFILVGGNLFFAKRFNNPKLEYTLKFLIPYAIFAFPYSAFSATLLSRNKIIILSLFNFLSKLFIIGCLIGLLQIKKDAHTAILTVVIATIISSIIALNIMFKACNEGSWTPTLRGIVDQLSYSVPVGLSTMLGNLNKNIDKFVISTLKSPKIFASYTNGAIEIPFISIVTTSITSILIVDYTKLYKQGKTKEILELIHKAMVKSSLMLFPLMFFLLLNSDEVMWLLFGKKYINSSIFFRIYLLLLPIRIFTFNATLRALGKVRPLVYQSFIILPLNAVASWFGVRVFGTEAAAWATVILTYAFTVPYYSFWIVKTLQIRLVTLFPWKKLIKIFMVSTVSAFSDIVILSSISEKFDVNSMPLFKIFLSGLVFFVAVYFGYSKLGLSDEISQVIKAIIKWR